MQEGDTEGEPYDDEEFEGYEDKPDTSSSKNKDPITIVDVGIQDSELQTNQQNTLLLLIPEI